MSARLPARAEPESERAGGAPRPRGQPLPLHRLPEHRQRRARRGQGVARWPPSTNASGIGAVRPAQGGRAADHRPGPLRRRHQAARAWRTPRSCARRTRTPIIKGIDTSAAEAHARRRQGPHGRDTLGLEGGVPCASNPFGDADAAEAADPGRGQGAHGRRADRARRRRVAGDRARRRRPRRRRLRPAAGRDRRRERGQARTRRSCTTTRRAITAARSRTRPRASTPSSTPRPSRSR